MLAQGAAGERDPRPCCHSLDTSKPSRSSLSGVFSSEAAGSQLFALGRAVARSPVLLFLLFPFFSTSLPPSPPGGGSSWASGIPTHPWATSWAP